MLSAGANARASAADIPENAFASGDTLLLQMEVPLAESLAAAAAARAAGARVILSLAPYAPLTPDQLAAIDMLVVNEHEAADFAAHLSIAGGTPEETVAGARRHARPRGDRHPRAGRRRRRRRPGGDPRAGAAGDRRSTPPAPATPSAACSPPGSTRAPASAPPWRARRSPARSPVTKPGAQPSFPTRAEIQDAAL